MNKGSTVGENLNFAGKLFPSSEITVLVSLWPNCSKRAQKSSHELFIEADDDLPLIFLPLHASDCISNYTQ